MLYRHPRRATSITAHLAELQQRHRVWLTGASVEEDRAAVCGPRSCASAGPSIATVALATASFAE